MWTSIKGTVISLLIKYLGRVVASEIYFQHNEYKKEAELKITEQQVEIKKLEHLNKELSEHVLELTQQVSEQLPPSKKLETLRRSNHIGDEVPDTLNSISDASSNEGTKSNVTSKSDFSGSSESSSSSMSSSSSSSGSDSSGM